MSVQQLKEVYGLLRRKNTPAILDLDESLRAKGDMTPEEELKIRALKVLASLGFSVTSVAFTFLAHSGLRFGSKLAGVPPLPRLLSLGLSSVGGVLIGKVTYYAFLQEAPKYILERGEERMKMELANIILNKHSDEKSLVEAVKGHFFAEHLFSDQYQDRPVFRWRLRHTYVDSAFMERVKEIEVNNSDHASGPISGQKTTNIRSFGDLMEDPLACILGSPDSNIESNKPAEHTGNIVKRREVRAHRRSHRHHHRHTDKFAAM